MVAESEQTVKFPKRLRHRGRGKVRAAIYKRADGFRLYWRTRVDGEPVSRMRDFSTDSEAKREGDKIVSDLHKGVATPLSLGGSEQGGCRKRSAETILRDHRAAGQLA